MSVFQKSHLTSKSAVVKAVAVSTVAAFVVGQFDLAESAVFEQNDNGKIVEIGSSPIEQQRTEQFNFRREHIVIPDNTPKQQYLMGNSNNARGNEPPASATAVVDISTPEPEFTDAPADDDVGAGFRPPSSPSTPSVGATSPSLLDALRGRLVPLSLPRARSMDRDLSEDQRNIYWLAADYGRRFASAPGVRKSSLDETMFIDLFTAMIQRESNFNTRAISPVGAKGLGQLMPGTATDLGISDPFSASQNLEGSARYLTDMLDQFGSTELALAAYNAGPGAVRKYGGIPPYRETRQYVSDILHAASVEPHSIANQVAKADGNAPAELLSFAAGTDETATDNEGAQKQAFDVVLLSDTAPEKSNPATASKRIKTQKRSAGAHQKMKPRQGQKYSARAESRSWKNTVKSRISNFRVSSNKISHFGSNSHCGR